jgi:tRNA dimethylallyltransferase
VKAICLMGPTASGKTEAAIRLCKRFPVDIISVDSALVYRGMDIGTAKPDAETRRRTPHRLIDIREPEQSYSAGEFVRDAHAEMAAIIEAGRIPLLVGGTMMYFRALTAGIAELPAADPGLRAEIDGEARARGWPAQHARLAEVDPAAAARINPNDSQRIQRALEVWLASGRALSDWQRDGGQLAAPCRYLRIGLWPASRRMLHERIESRLNSMLNNGFLEEVRRLRERDGLTSRHPSMRAVGYRQFWEHLDGATTLEQARTRALAATRQLAKRQITWLRSEASLSRFDPLEASTIDAISSTLIEFFDA